MNNITHVAIHHDPEDRCNYQLEAHEKDLRDLFVNEFVAVTKRTTPITSIPKFTVKKVNLYPGLSELH